MTSRLIWSWDRLMILWVTSQVIGAFLVPVFPQLSDHVLLGDVCHQLPERSFSLGGITMPLCGRCTAIFIGFLAGRFGWGIHAWSGGKLLLALCGMTVMLLEWKLSHMGVWSSTNALRALVGVLFGFGFSYVFHAMPLIAFRNMSTQRLKNWVLLRGA